jgi:hypothetical protein
MRDLFLLKVAPYGLRGMQKDFTYYSDLAAQKISPPLLEGAQTHIIKSINGKIMRVDVLLCSPQERAIQTARILKENFFRGTEITVDNNLNEIPFSLGNIAPSSYSSTEARKTFLSDFMSDSLLESRDQIKRRVKRVLRVRKGIRVLMVTHTFFMKVVEAFAKYPDLFENPEKLKLCFSTGKKLVEYCGMLKITGNKIVKI